MDSSDLEQAQKLVEASPNPFRPEENIHGKK
jgi:hypothetical protein